MPSVDKKSIQPLYRNLELAACDLFSRDTDEGTAFVRLERYRKTKRELKAHPRPRSLRLKWRVMKGPAPVIIAMSNPKSSPPRAAVQARKST